MHFNTAAEMCNIFHQMELKSSLLDNLLILVSLCKVICLLQTLLLSSLWSFSTLKQPGRLQSRAFCLGQIADASAASTSKTRQLLFLFLIVPKEES